MPTYNVHHYRCFKNYFAVNCHILSFVNSCEPQCSDPQVVFYKVYQQHIFNFYLCFTILDMVHRDLKLENILLSKNHKDRTDDLFIKVTTSKK